MLSQLRQNTKIVLWIVIVAFIGLIFVVWGMNLKKTGGVQAGIIGKVAGTRVTVEEYRSEVANQRAAYFQDKTRRHDTQAEQDINQRAWDAVVQNHLLSREVRKQQLAATEDEVMIEMQANPPPFIRSQPVFQTDSAFDQSKYIAALSDPQYDFRPLESYIRATLPLHKLQEYLVSGVRVTDDEAKLMLSLLDEKAVISYVVVNPSRDVKDVIASPTESEIASYYSSRPDEFKVPELHKFRYAEFVKKPSAEDEQFAKDRIQEAYDAITAEIETGNAPDPASVEKAFGEAAGDYSDDEVTGAKGGDLGWVKRGQLRGVLDSVAFALDPGKVSDVIRTEGGYHLLMVAERRVTGGVEEVRLRHIMTRLEASPSTLDQLGIEAADFASLARRKGIDKAAADGGITLATSPDLSAEQVSGFFRMPKDLAETVFKLDKKTVGDATEGAQAFYVIEPSNVIPGRTPPLEEIKDRIRQAYVVNLKKEKARQIAASIAQEVTGGKSLEAAAASWNLTVAKSQPFTETVGAPGIGKDNLVIARAFTLSPGQTSSAIENAGQYYVVRLDELHPPDLKSLGGSFDQLKYSLLSTKQQAFINDWYSDLLARAKVQDNRSLETGGRTGKRTSSGSLYTGY
jgi:peptidyl-prolyl cis-trans isomerase D